MNVKFFESDKQSFWYLQIQQAILQISLQGVKFEFMPIKILSSVRSKLKVHLPYEPISSK